ncbi:hypothetical protein WJX73_002973 [Symbiochloris irregularis]|uniref:Mitochondrial carrier protein n=1 Tax=Symbiochloris irregularis TaxID=706552 RepID=A0AAW1NRG1_9CHLO
MVGRLQGSSLDNNHHSHAKAQHSGPFASLTRQTSDQTSDPLRANKKRVLCLAATQQARRQALAFESSAARGIGWAAVGARKLAINGLAWAPKDFRRLFAGAIAGAVSKTATAPIETVRMQLMTGAKGTGVLQVLRSTWCESGFLGFFSGNDADVLRTMPSKAIELASYDLYKRLLSRKDHTGRRRSPGPVASTVAGAAAGMTSGVLLFPLETVRTRLAVNSKKYTSISTTVRTIARDEGLLSFYKGLSVSLLGAIPYTATRLALYDGLKWSYRKATKREDVPPQSYPHPWAALMTVANEEGVSALYRGLGLTCIKQAPSQAIVFLVYDALKEVLQTEKEFVKA